MPLPALAFASIDGDVAAAVERVPTGSGVAQILGPEGRSLVVGMAANVRRWVASRLGLGPSRPAGKRPPTNLAGVATAVGWAEVDGPFRQRLLFERLMAPLVPLAARRDLKPPAFLRLDLSDRFPRLVVCGGGTGRGALFGPWRDRRSAEKARDAVHRLFPLRPCDYAFEPDPALPLGLGCLYAQVRSCAAPCLGRTGEDAYRALAARAAAWLADPVARGQAPAAVSPIVGAADGRGVVVDVGRREVGLYPVAAGSVLDSAAVLSAPGELDSAVAWLEWPEREEGADWPWLAGWLGSAKGRRSYVRYEGGDRGSLARAVLAAVPAGLGGNVGASRERA